MDRRPRNGGQGCPVREILLRSDASGSTKTWIGDFHEEGFPFRNNLVHGVLSTRLRQDDDVERTLETSLP